MGTRLDLLGGFDGFLKGFQLAQHLFEPFFISFFFGNGQLFGYLVVKLFDFGFKNRNEIFHSLTPGFSRDQRRQPLLAAF